MKMTLNPAFNSVLLIHSAINLGTDVCVVTKGERGNVGYVCSYSSTITLYFYGYTDCLLCC